MRRRSSPRSEKRVAMVSATTNGRPCSSTIAIHFVAKDGRSGENFSHLSAANAMRPPVAVNSIPTRAVRAFSGASEGVGAGCTTRDRGCSSAQIDEPQLSIKTDQAIAIRCTHRP
jgi:hypothetical protein